MIRPKFFTRSYSSTLAVALLMFGMMSCVTTTENPHEDTRDLRTKYALAALPAHPVYPANNQKNTDRFILGWRLFYDPVLSATKDVACGTCHHARFGMSDARERSLGVLADGLGPERKQLSTEFLETARNSQSIINTAFFGSDPEHSPMFWDGRATSLEEQALEPIQTPGEMAGKVFPKDHVLDSIVSRLRTYPLYESYFKIAFTEEADSVKAGTLPSAITASTLARALASFEREVNSPNSRFDLYVRGNDSAITAEEKSGAAIFYGKAGCGSCHSGPLLSDSKFYAQGAEQRGPGRDGFSGADWGRAETNGNSADKFKFKTPTLRNLERTAPYMHDGSIATIEAVIEHYDRGLNASTSVPSSFLDKSFRPLGLLAAEKRDLILFLKTLTDDTWQEFAVPPASVPSGLRVPR